MNEPFLQLEKSFFSSPFWTEKRVKSRAEAWIDIKETSRWEKEPNKVSIGKHEFVCNRTECLFSLETWATRWGWKSKHKVKSFLEHLKKLGWIKFETLTVTVRVTVILLSTSSECGNGLEAGKKTKTNGNGLGTDAGTTWERGRERLSNAIDTTSAECGNGVGNDMGTGSGTDWELTDRYIDSLRPEDYYYQLQTNKRGEGDFQSPPPSPPLKTRKPLPQKTMTLDEPVEPALKTWIDRFAAYVLEATGHPLENMPKQTAAAIALIRNRGHTVEELNKILDYILSTKHDAGFRWYGNVLSIINLNAKTSKGDSWKSHCILAQSSTKRAYSRENPAPGSREAMDIAMDKAMEDQPLPF